MPLEISHVLVNVDDLGALLIDLIQKALDDLSEFGVLFLDHSLILLVLRPDVGEELLEMLRVIHDELVNDGLVEVAAGELVGISLYNHCRHVGEVL